MNLRNILAKELAKGNVKILPHPLLASLTPDMEWIKWLTFNPNNKKILTEQQEQSNNFKEQNVENFLKEQRIANLLKLYGSNKITTSEYLECYYFMKENNIEKYMLSKLSKEELEIASKKIKYYNKISQKELKNKIKNDTENYQSLSPVNAFILHYLIKINIKKESKKVEQEIDNQIKRNQYTHQLGLHYAKKSFVKK